MNEKPCTFCTREGITPPASGSRANGSYRQFAVFDVGKPRVFNGYVCEMHADNVDWITLNWHTDKTRITKIGCMPLPTGE